MEKELVGKELEQPDDIKKQQAKNLELAAKEISEIIEKYGITLYGIVELPVTNLKVALRNEK